MGNLTIPAELLTQRVLDEILINPTSTKLSSDASVLLDRIKEAGKEHKLLMCQQPLTALVSNDGQVRRWLVYDGLQCLLWHTPHMPLSRYSMSVAEETRYWLVTGIHRVFILGDSIVIPQERAASALQRVSRQLAPVIHLGEVALHISGSTLEQRLAESRGRFYYLFQSHLPDVPTSINPQVQNPTPQIVPE